MDTHLIARRTVLLAGAGLAAPPSEPALPVPAGNAMAFRMVRHGGEIGRHTLAFERRGDALDVHIAVDAVVTLLSIPLYRYRHRGTETWRDGRLVGLVGETDKNSEHEWVKASHDGEGLVVLGSQAARYVAPASALATSYWNRRMLDGPMISLEDGVLLRPKVALRRGDKLRLADGGSLAADHYTLSGAFDVDLWYDASETWASLSFTAPDGSEIRYERL